MLKDESQILKAIRKGHVDAFDLLFEYYYPRLVAYLIGIVNEEIAKDIVQDTFLYIWEKRKTLLFGQGFSSYLFQSVYARAIDQLRRDKRFYDYSSETISTLSEQYLSIAHLSPKELNNLYKKDFYLQLYKILEELPVQRREAFILSYIDGMKAKEVAATMNIPQRTVESHIYLANKHLKKRLNKDDY